MVARYFIVLLLSLLTLPVSTLCGTAEVVPLQGRVNDYAHMLQPATIRQLEQVLKVFAQQESTQIAVLTIATLGGDSLEEYSLRVAETWGLGQQHKDNGALLLIVRNERKLRIEVGYGLEGSLTDLVAGRIIRDVITPQFRQGNFDQGVINGVEAMIAAVKGEFKNETPPGDTIPPGHNLGSLAVFLFYVLFMIGRLFRRHGLLAMIAGAILFPVIGMLALGWSWLLLLVLAPLGMFFGLIASQMAGSAGGGTFYSSGGRSSWGSGGGFGGGFSGGGGGFGGGGASGGW
jgi:uncharacterized protein